MSDKFELLEAAVQLPLTEVQKDCTTLDLPDGFAALYILLPRDHTRIHTLYRHKLALCYQLNLGAKGHEGEFDPVEKFPKDLAKANPKAPIALRLIGSRKGLRRLSTELTEPDSQSQLEFHRHVENRLGHPQPQRQPTPKLAPFDPFDL